MHAHSVTTSTNWRCILLIQTTHTLPAQEGVVMLGEMITLVLTIERRRAGAGGESPGYIEGYATHIAGNVNRVCCGFRQRLDRNQGVARGSAKGRAWID